MARSCLSSASFSLTRSTVRVSPSLGPRVTEMPPLKSLPALSPPGRRAETILATAMIRDANRNQCLLATKSNTSRLRTKKERLACHLDTSQRYQKGPGDHKGSEHAHRHTDEQSEGEDRKSTR